MTGHSPLDTIDHSTMLVADHTRFDFRVHGRAVGVDNCTVADLNRLHFLYSTQLTFTRKVSSWAMEWMGYRSFAHLIPIRILSPSPLQGSRAHPIPKGASQVVIGRMSAAISVHSCAKRIVPYRSIGHDRRAGRLAGGPA